MDIKRFLRLTACAVLFALFAGQMTAQAGTSRQTDESSAVIEISSEDFQTDKEEFDGFYGISLQVPGFDQATLTWESVENPGFSLRVLDPGSGQWGDWQALEESGQTYIRSMGGLFSFDFFSSGSDSLTLEIRAEKTAEAGLKSVRLQLYNETENPVSTIVMIVVMLAAGGVLYIKKRRMLQK